MVYKIFKNYYKWKCVLLLKTAFNFDIFSFLNEIKNKQKNGEMFLFATKFTDENLS